MTGKQKKLDVFSRATFSLPENLTPTGLRCIQLNVPDDLEHLTAFYGAISLLANWNSWQRDDSQSGKAVSQVWKNAISSPDFMTTCSGDVIRIYEETDEMGIRVDCDCNVFVTCCDGTEIQLATLADITRSNQPGSGRRPPIGQSTCFPVTLNAKNTWLLPFSVSTGDVLTITDLAGAWSSDGIAWTCPDGTPFVAGLCTGSRYHVAGDPDGTLYHGQLAFMISGVYYSATDGPFTVPGGISNASCYLIANLERVLSAAGDVVFKVCAENGATPPLSDWCAYLDFTVSDYGWVPDPITGYPGIWVPGDGWVNDLGVGGKLEVKYVHPGSPTWRATSELYCYCSTPNSSGGVNANVAGIGNVIQTASVSAGDFTAAGGGADHAGSTWSFNIQNGGAGPYPTVKVRGALIYGSGTMPTGWPAC